MRLRLFISLVALGLLLIPLLAQEQPEPITPDTYRGVIDDNNISDRYAFEALTGQEIIIEMNAVDDSLLDAQLFLFDANEEPLADNDDIGDGSRDARIVFSPTVGGVFIIEATRFRQNVGTTSGPYTLTLTINNTATDPNNPLSVAPPFAVEFTETSFGAVTNGTFATESENFEYFVVPAEIGNFVSIELITANNLEASIRLLTRIEQTLSVVSAAIDQNIIFATIPQTAWYLIEVERLSGIGNFALTPTIISETLLTDDTPTESTFDATNDTRFFVFNATINERVFVNLRVLEGAGIQPELTILDLNDNELDQRATTGTQTRVTITAPRSSPYVVRARNLGVGNGEIELQIRRSSADISKLTVRPANYNEDYAGFISDDNPIDYYRFSGKAGELVTIQMDTVGTYNELDPYLIVTDSNLNELIFNDNTSASRSAQIAAFALPADGDYFILASRAGLSDGTSIGRYALAITVGELRTEVGALTATLRWQGTADLNLFIRTPEGYAVSWANPQPPAGGILQIDSNTGCNTPTDQPIEHIYWQDPPSAGDYTIWVWYQDTCTTADATTFTLEVSYNDTPIALSDSSNPQIGALNPDDRFEASIRVTENNTAVIVNRGQTSQPSPQQTASQGGDTLILYDTPTTGSITDNIFAQFYQFEGNAGDTLIITVDTVTGDLDPIVALRDSRDTTLIFNDDNPDTNTTNSRLTYTLEEDGRYIVAVTRFGVRDGTTTGNYTLTITLTDTE